MQLYDHRRLVAVSSALSSPVVSSLPTTELLIDGSSLPVEMVTVYCPSGAQVVQNLDVDLKVSVNEIRSIPLLGEDRQEPTF